MKNFNSYLLGAFVLTASLISFNSCENRNCKEDNISASGGHESHNMGQNCMHCHKSGGEGEGCFNVAGTAYDANEINTLSSGKIDFYTDTMGSGNLKYSVYIDGKGNFYTTADMNIDGLYPVITGPTGSKSYMSTSISTGQCNSCHGVSTSKIWSN